jgi:hypothetical protein
MIIESRGIKVRLAMIAKDSTTSHSRILSEIRPIISEFLISVQVENTSISRRIAFFIGIKVGIDDAS